MTNNAARGFRASLAENLAQVFLGQGHFEDLVQLLEPNAAAREVRVIFDEGEQLDDNGPVVTTRVQRAEVVIAKDPNATCGGLATPVPGLSMQLPDGRVYQWTERVIEADESSHTLEFQRVDVRAVGQLR